MLSYSNIKGVIIIFSKKKKRFSKSYIEKYFSSKKLKNLFFISLSEPKFI
jgi:hypothetical protein